MAERVFEIDIPGVGKKKIALDLPADATDDEINASVNHAGFQLFNQSLVKNAPGPRKAPLPYTLSPGAPTPSALGIFRNEPTADVDQENQNFLNAGRNENANDQSAALKLGTGAAMMAGGAPLWSAALSGALTNSPADAATNIAGAGLSKILEPLKSANRMKNVLLGATKGAGSYELLNRFHQLISGDQQTPVNPLDRPASQNSMQALATTLGLVSGYSGAEAPEDPNAAKQAAYDSFLKNRKQLNTDLGTNAEAQDAAAKATKVALFNRQDAASRANQFESALDQKADLAGDEQSKLFRAAQQEFRKQIKSTGFQRQDAQANLTEAEKALADHQADVAEQHQALGVSNAEQTRNSILDQQRILDGLRNPDTAEQFLPLSDEEQKMQATIAEQTARLNSGKYNEGAMNQQKALITKTEQELEDSRDARIRLAQDQTKDRIRRMQADMSRQSQGRFDDEAVAASAEKTADLTDQRDQAAQSLAALNDKYRQLQIAQLSHAQNAPGAPLTAVNDVQELQRLRNAAEAAKNAHREASLKQDDLKAQATQIQNAIKAMTVPDKPSQADQIKAQVLRYLPKALASGATMGEFGSLAHVAHPAAGALLGALGAAAATNPAMKELFGFLSSRLGPGLPAMIGSTVNNANAPQQ